MFVESLNGFPGVYTYYVDETLGEDGLLKLLDGVVRDIYNKYFSALNNSEENE